MSEFTRPRWAVISERGDEASGLDYDEALERMRRLTAEKVNGLAIVTDEAARRFNHTTAPTEKRNATPANHNATPATRN